MKTKNKSKRSKGIIGITLAAIMIASIFAMVAPTTVADPDPDPATTINTVRIYGEDGAGAGAWVPGESVAGRILDPKTDQPAEQQPYTDVYSIFFPQGDESPRKDFITFNPVYISEIPGDDQSELHNCGLADDIMADSADANEKVFLRQWYQPDYLDKDIDVTGWVTYRINPGPNKKLETANLSASDDMIVGNFVVAGADGVLDSIVGDSDGDGAIESPDSDDFVQLVPSMMPDEHYPAILQEYTYMFVKHGTLSSETIAVSGSPGEGTAFVFPVGIKEDLFWDLDFGYGLTTLDPTLDGVDNPTVVEIHTEDSLSAVTNIGADFNGDGNINKLDDDGTQLTGDELAILTPPTLNDIGQGEMIQFLDHAIEVREVYTDPASIKLRIYYTGDIEPKFVGDVIVATKDMVLVGTKRIYTYLESGEDNLGVLPKGPFFVYVDAIDAATNSANIKIGRAVGATHSAMERAVGAPDAVIPDPWWLKRFYVDGHEYNVVAIYSDPEDAEKFKFITIRTPIPKEGEDLDPVVLIEQHSVRLQPYEENRALSMMPPYNYEHTELADVQAWDCTMVDKRIRGEFSDPGLFSDPGFFVGEPYLAKPIYHTTGPYTRIGEEEAGINIELEDLMFYVEEAREPQLKGELKEKYNEGCVDEWWYVEQFWTKPDQYTEFYMPVGHGLYLLTLNYVAPEMYEEVVKYIPNIEGGPGIAEITMWEGGRAKFWYNASEGGKKFKDENGIRLYGASFDEAEYVLARQTAEMWDWAWWIAPGCPGYNEALSNLCNLTPKFPIDLDDLIRAGDTSIDDPKTGEFVEDAPYTDWISIFNPQGAQAYPKSILTVDPAWMDEYWAGDELKDLGLYAQISIEGDDAREKVFGRMWYEPYHLDKNVDSDDYFDSTDEWYPAIMEEYTYMLVGVDSQPAHGQPGETMVAFPIGTEGWQLDEDKDHPGADGIWGYGLTTFDPLPYDDYEEAYTVVVHSEQTLADYTNISCDFDGDHGLDPLDYDGYQFSGDELAIFTTTLNLHEGDKAQFLDYLVEVVSVTDTPAAVTLKFYRLGDMTGAPKALTPTRSLESGDMVTLYLGGVNPRIVADGSNLGRPMTEKGPWFAYVDALNPGSNNVALTIGRALGATHTAMEDNGNPDMREGDPWYLKRFYVDGHEYNVVAIKTELADAPGPDTHEFKFITIRTPVQKEETVIDQHSFRCQGYYTGDLPDQLYVMPPFNYEHTARVDIQEDWLPPRILKDPLGYMGPLEKHKAPLDITIVDEDIEWQFLGDLKEIYQDENVDREYPFQTWDTMTFWNAPFRYTELKINAPDEKYLMKLDWRAPQGIFQLVNYYNDDSVDLIETVDAGIIPNVKFWYDQDDTTDLYINTKEIGIVTVSGFVNDVAGKYDGLYGATVTISNGTWSKDDTTDIAGNYDLGEVDPGEYTVSASQPGYITEMVVLTLQRDVVVDFTYENGLIPDDPNMDYVLESIRLWYEGKISMGKVMEVISAWSS
jgi:hypothetical protein